MNKEAVRTALLCVSVWSPVILGASVARGQIPGVPAGLCNGTWMTIGPGQYQCAPAPQPPMPQFDPNTQPQNPDNIYNNALTREIERLGSLLDKNPFQPNAPPESQPIADNKTVSAALSEMLSSSPPPAPPVNYQDPFGSGVSSGGTSGPQLNSQAPVSAAPSSGVVNDNLKDIGTMQMQSPPSQQNGNGGAWQNPDPYNTHCTGGFNC